MNQACIIESREYWSGPKSGLTFTVATRYADAAVALKAHKLAASDCRIGLVRREAVTGANYVIRSLVMVEGTEAAVDASMERAKTDMLNELRAVENNPPWCADLTRGVGGVVSDSVAQS